MKSKSIPTGIAIAVIGISLSACGGSSSAATTPASSGQQATSAPAPTIVIPTSPAAPNLDLGVSGSGEVKAAQDADLVFLAQGTVAEVRVKEGNLVKKGDVLASLDIRVFDQQVHQAQAALDNAKAQEAGLTQSPTGTDAAAAAAQVRQAKAALDALQAGAKAPDRAQVQAAYNAAKLNLDRTRDQLSLAKTQAESTMNQAAQALTQAQARYAQAKTYWDHIQAEGTDPVVPTVTDPKTGKKVGNTLSEGQRENYYAQLVQAEAAMHQAEQGLNLAQAAFEAAKQNEITGIAAAEQQLAQAQASLDKINLPADSAQLAAAQAALAAAQAAQARLTAAPRDAQKAAAAAGIAQAQAALELAQINREHAEIRAPFDGIVAAVNIDPGDPSTVVGQPAIKLVDVSSLHIDAQIADVDISKVAVGQSVEVRADAMGDKVYKGKVSYVSPTASAVGTIRTYLVRVMIDDQEGLRAGMSARVDIITK